MKIVHYLPIQTLENSTFKSMGWDSDKIYKKTGIQKRHISDKEETALDLAENACKKLITKNEKNKIDFLLYITQSPDYTIPSNCCILQNRLGLNSNIGAIDINMGCSGYIYGISIAKALIQSNQANQILLVTSDTYTKYIHAKDKANRSIFGDGSSATLLSKADDRKIGEIVFGTDGEGAMDLHSKRNGLKHIGDDLEEIYEDKSGNIRKVGDLIMNGPSIFAFTMNKVPELVDNILDKNKLNKSDITYYLLHQANAFMLNKLREQLGIEASKFIIRVKETGNTVSTSIPLILEDLMPSCKKGDRILIAGFGVGYSWGGTVITI